MIPNFASSILIKPVLQAKGKKAESIGADEQVVEEPPKFHYVLKCLPMFPRLNFVNIYIASFRNAL